MKGTCSPKTGPFGRRRPRKTSLSRHHPARPGDPGAENTAFAALDCRIKPGNDEVLEVSRSLCALTIHASSRAGDARVTAHRRADYCDHSGI